MKQYPECAYPLYTVARSGQLVRIGERVPWFSHKDKICVTFAYDPENDGGRSMALDVVDDD